MGPFTFRPSLPPLIMWLIAKNSRVDNNLDKLQSYDTFSLLSAGFTRVALTCWLDNIYYCRDVFVDRLAVEDR